MRIIFLSKEKFFFLSGNKGFILIGCPAELLQPSSAGEI
jgi:hypothetical protein